MNVYLTGGAVRDLISGQSIRDLDFTVEGNPVRMVRELEKGGARVVWESEKLRHYEIAFAGEADGSISAAREDVYESPGAKPEYRFAGIMEDLRRRDFSINGIAISLNAQSRGLLLDPTNGLADLERQEVRALSIHAFTNQPVRLLRALRYCARMGFKMESRTQEWFDLAIERGLDKNMESGDVGNELRSVSRERRIPSPRSSNGKHTTCWRPSTRNCSGASPITTVSTNWAESVRTTWVRDFLSPPAAGGHQLHPRPAQRPRGSRSHAQRWSFAKQKSTRWRTCCRRPKRSSSSLKGRKTNTPHDAYFYLASVPAEMLIFVEIELPNPRALSKIRNYIQKWRPIRLALPGAELDALGIPRGPKFDSILEQLLRKCSFAARREPRKTRTKALRNLAGIREEPVKKPEKPKRGKSG